MIECISLWQPWASLIFTTPRPVKTYETRSFPAPARVIGKRIGIHAAQKIVLDRNISQELADVCDYYLGSDWQTSVPRGVLVGTVEVDHVIQSEQEYQQGVSTLDLIAGNWMPERYGWKLIKPIRCDVPIPTKGQQGWFKIGEDLFGPFA